MSSACGLASRHEDFATGRYNVHAYPLMAPAGVAVEVALAPTGGAWLPALILHDSGLTIHDGERSLSRPGLAVETLAGGRAAEAAAVRILAEEATQLSVFVTDWDVIDGDFLPPLSQEASYSIGVHAECEATLLQPPNFDPDDVIGGYHLLPHSEAPGLYTRKDGDDCARGTKLLIDVLYTVASRWHDLRPTSPIAFRDLNFRSSCSSVNHQTHDDGTHADLVVSCATQVSCAEKQPAIDLARLFVDTGEVCGILFNDSAVQAEANAYFSSLHAYEPWKGTFMRTVTGHTGHFHVRVKKPDGTCN